MDCPAISTSEGMRLDVSERPMSELQFHQVSPPASRYWQNIDGSNFKSLRTRLDTCPGLFSGSNCPATRTSKVKISGASDSPMSDLQFHPASSPTSRYELIADTIKTLGHVRACPGRLGMHDEFAQVSERARSSHLVRVKALSMSFHPPSLAS